MHSRSVLKLQRCGVRTAVRSYHHVPQRLARIHCSPTAGFLEDCKVLTVDEKKYVLLEEVEKELNPFVNDAEGTKAKLQGEVTQAQALAEKLQKEADTLKQELEEKQTQLAAVEVEVEEAREAARRAVLVAAEQLEERFQAAYRQAHQQETAALQEQLSDAVKMATAAEEKAVEAARQAGEQLMKRTEEAAQQAEASAFSYLSLAKGASSAAQLAAEEASTSVKVSLQQQQQALALTKSLQETATAAEARAAASHQQAQALVGEVGALRNALATAQQDAAAAAKRAAQAEAAAAERVAQADGEVAARLAALESAYEQLKQGERERVKRALEENQALMRQNEHLVREGEKLRSDFTAAEHAVAQVRGQAEAAEAAMREREVALEKEFQGRLAAQAQELGAQALVEVHEGQAAQWSSSSAEIKAVRSRLEGGSNESSGQVAALQRVVEAQSQERAYWRSRCLKAEGEARMLSLQLKKSLDALSSVKATTNISSGDKVGSSSYSVGVPRRVSSLLNKERLWQFMSSGPRGQSPLGSGFVLGTSTIESTAAKNGAAGTGGGAGSGGERVEGENGGK